MMASGSISNQNANPELERLTKLLVMYEFVCKNFIKENTKGKMMDGNMNRNRAPPEKWLYIISLNRQFRRYSSGCL